MQVQQKLHYYYYTSCFRPLARGRHFYIVDHNHKNAVDLISSSEWNGAYYFFETAVEEGLR